MQSTSREAFPEGLTEMGNNTFVACSLESIRLPTLGLQLHFPEDGDSAWGFRWIGNQAFMGCTSLETIVIPVTVNAISQMTFSDCRSLRMVELCGGIQMTEGDAFHRCGLLDGVKICSKALVVTESGELCNFAVPTVCDFTKNI